MINPGVIRLYGGTANIFYFILYIQKNIAGGIPMMNCLRIETASFRGKVENNINQIIKCIDLTCVYHVSLHYTLSSLSVTLSYTMSMLMVVPLIL